MSKVKIYEIAKELNIENKEIIEEAKKLGIEVKSHLSSIEETDAKKIKESLKNKQVSKKDKKPETKKILKKKAKKKK